MSGQSVSGVKNVYFMRHGRALTNTDYENLNYDEFMNFMLKRHDPALHIERNEITIPVKVDVIYPSSSRRAKESAELIQCHLAHPPIIDDSLEELADEVEFAASILSKGEFEERGGLKGCRDLILERWFNGENVESIEQSIERLNRLRDVLLKSKFSNILIITHGWYLRLVCLCYTNKEISLKNLRSVSRLNYGEVLRESLMYPQNLYSHDYENLVNALLNRRKGVSMPIAITPELSSAKA